MIDLRLGNVLDVLAQMPSESVHCIVTSPPYWGLRAYGTEPQVWRNGSEPCVEHEWGDAIPPPKPEEKRSAEQFSAKSTLGPKRDGLTPNNAGFQVKTSLQPSQNSNTCTVCGAWRGELGLEPQPEMFVEHIIAVMREARRVLRADGTLWLNIGDSYVGGKGANNHRWSMEHPDRPTLEKPHHHLMIETGRPCDNMEHMRGAGLKPKDLVGIPWRVAFALQQDGWYLRSDIIWHKPNPMPESVRDRPTKAHEYIFLMSKQPRYYYDADAVRENLTESTKERVKYGLTTNKANVGNCLARGEPITSHYDKMGERFAPAAGRNRRSVWTVTTHPYSGAHFATFPPKLIEPCILAATSERGVCSKCGAPWVRVVERHSEQDAELVRVKGEAIHQIRKAGERVTANGTQPHFDSAEYKTTGWLPSCTCDAGEPVPATVLDPFNGAGTTGLVALQHGRRYIGIDLKQEYLDMTRARLDKAQLVMV